VKRERSKQAEARMLGEVLKKKLKTLHYGETPISSKPAGSILREQANVFAGRGVERSSKRGPQERGTDWGSSPPTRRELSPGGGCGLDTIT